MTTMTMTITTTAMTVTDDDVDDAAAAVLRPAEAAVAETGRHGLPVLRRPRSGRPRKVTREMVDRLREELAL